MGGSSHVVGHQSMCVLLLAHSCDMVSFTLLLSGILAELLQHQMIVRGMKLASFTLLSLSVYKVEEQSLV